MLSRPMAGWTTLKLKEIAIPVSYVTDAPYDFAMAFMRYLSIKKPQIVTVDSESDGEYQILFTKEGVYVIHYDEVVFVEIDILSLISEFCSDIFLFVDDWETEWYDSEETQEDIEELKVKVKEVFELLEEEKHG